MQQRKRPRGAAEEKVDNAARKFGAGPDDLRRLIVLAAQRNHVLVGKMRLGALTDYAKGVCAAVERIEDDVYEPQGACSTRDAAIRGAQHARDTIVLSPTAVSPDTRRRSV